MPGWPCRVVPASTAARRASCRPAALEAEGVALSPRPALVFVIVVVEVASPSTGAGDVVAGGRIPDERHRCTCRDVVVMRPELLVAPSSS